MIGKLHKEVLSDEALTVLGKSKFLRLQGFYLAGGTALAMQIGHRKSIDLDFFHHQPIKKTLLSEVEEQLDASAQIILKTTKELTLNILGIKITFLHYPFDLSFETVKTDSVHLASINDIASMKAYALGRRQSLKDYIDLYTVFKNGYTTLDSVMTDCQKKYKGVWNDRLFLEQLLYTDDLEEEEIFWLTNAVSKEKARSFFEEQIRTMKK